MRRATVLATVVLVLGALAAPALAVAPDAVPDEGAASLDRIDGETRFHTAARTALRAFPDGAETVLIATGLNFPDALAASFMAGGSTEAPILLVEREHLPVETTAALDSLAPSRIVVLGGDDAIATETVQELADTYTDADVDVIGGATRIETAAMIARQGGDVGTAPDLTDPDATEELTTAIVARAGDFPDALSSGPLALEGRHPILLTPTDTLDDTTRDALTDPDLGIEQVILTGGTVAISAEVENAIADLDNIVSVARVSGENRTATAVELADLTRDLLGWDGSNISLARGDFFPDALTVSPLAADLEASLFLSRNPETIEGDTFQGIQALCAEVQEVLITGGTLAISNDAAGEAKLATICADHVFPISGEQQVAEGDEDAAGTGWVTVVDDTVCTAYDVAGLEDAQASHIHAGVEGTNGDIVLDLGVPNANGFLADCSVSAEVAAGITANPFAYYVNIHTAEFPQGAARGQLEGTEDIEVALEGETEVQEDGTFADAPSNGTGTLDLYLREGELCYELTVSGLESPVDPSIAGGFHIHQGAFGTNGDIVLPLPQEQSATDYTAWDCVEADQALLDDIAANPQGYYANLHTVDGADPDVPANGTLRGQLGADAELQVYGDAEVDDSTPTEPVFGQGADGLIGDARVFFTSDDTVCVDLELPEGGEALTGAHIHTGTVDVNGPIVIDFADLAGQQDGVDCATETAPEVASVMGDLTGHYLNVHTATFPAGAARNQLAGDLATELSGAAEVGDDAGDPMATGSARAYQASATNPDVVCGDFRVEGADPLTAAHIHDAPAGENGPVVVTIGDYGDPGLEAPGADITSDFGCQTDVDTTTAADIFATPSEYYMNVHSETFTAGAVRGQFG